MVVVQAERNEGGDSPDSDSTITYEALPRPPRSQASVPDYGGSSRAESGDYPSRLPGQHGGSDVVPVRNAPMSGYSSMASETTARYSGRDMHHYSDTISSYSSNGMSESDSMASERAAAERRRTYFCMVRRRIEQLADELEIMYPKDPEFSHLGPAIKSMASILPSH